MSLRIERTLVWAVLTMPSWAIVEKYSGLPGVAAYSVAMALVVRFMPAITGRLSPRWVVRLSLLTALAMILVFALVYPRVNARVPGAGSDDDDAHDVGVAALLSGESPYRRTTYLGNELHQLPGSYLLAAPFAIAGGSALQGLFWLPLFFVVALRAHASDSRPRLAMAWMTACSANIIHDIVTGSSYPSNAISVLLAMSVVVRYPRWWAAGAFLCGVAMCSRANFPLLLVPLCGFLWRVQGPRRSMRVALVVTATATGLTWPFDPLRPGFPPMTGAFARLQALDAFAPAAAVTVLALAILMTLVLSMRIHKESTLWLCCGAIQAVPVVLGFAVGAAIDWKMALWFLPYGTFAMWFVLAGLAPRSGLLVTEVS